MDFKGISIIFILTAICLVHTNAFPRDSSVVEPETVVMKNPDIKKLNAIPRETAGIPGRVTCPYEEATEDANCQEHCLPKGYSYGICVGGTCSCI